MRKSFKISKLKTSNRTLETGVESIDPIIDGWKPPISILIKRVSSSNQREPLPGEFMFDSPRRPRATSEARLRHQVSILLLRSKAIST